MGKFGSVNEVLDFAIGREVEAHEFYVELAGMVEKPQMVKVLSDLAIVTNVGRPPYRRCVAINLCQIGTSPVAG
jgi:hypothetical protein